MNYALLAVLLLGATCARATQFVIIHSTDVHGYLEEYSSNYGGLARIVALDKTIKAKYAGTDVLLLDSGDLMFAAPPTNQLLNGTPTIDIFNRRGVGAVTVGNHDFDLGLDVLKRAVASSNFSWLSCNIVKSDTEWETPEWLSPYKVFTLPTSGVRVGVIGVTTDLTPLMSVASHLTGLTFREVFEAVSHWYPVVAAQSEVVVVLAHVGCTDSVRSGSNYIGTVSLAQKLAAANMSVPLILSGHDHYYTTTPYHPTANTYVVDSYSYSRSLGQMVLSNSSGTWAFDTTKFYMNKIDSKIAMDASTVSLIASYNSIVAPRVSAIAGVSYVNLSYSTPESNMGDIIADGFLWEADRWDNGVVDGSVHAAFYNTGGVRTSLTLPAGATSRTLTWGDLFNANPFYDTLWILEMPGTALFSMMAFTSQRPPLSSGIEWLYWGNTTAGSAGTAYVNGKPLNLSATYRVVTTDYLMDGSTGYPAFAHAVPVNNTGVPQFEALYDYVVFGLEGVIQKSSIPMPRLQDISKCSAASALNVASEPAIEVASSGFVSLDMFQIAVDAPAVVNRSAITFTVGSCLLKTDLVPKYNGSKCAVQYLLKNTWTKFVSCGVSLDAIRTTSEFSVYGGVIKAAYDEKIGAIQGQDLVRKTVNSLPFYVSFPNTVSASVSNVKVYAAPDVQASVVSVAVDSASLSTSSSVGVSFQTSIQSPFVLQISSFATSQSSTPVSLAFESVQRSSSMANGFTFQTWGLNIVPLTNTCKLSSIGLTVAFTLGCDQTQLSGGLCPFSSSQTVQLQFLLSTSDFCGQVVEDVSLSAAMTTFRDAEHTSAASAFFLGDEVHVVANINSPLVSIESVSLASIVVSGSAVVSSIGTNDVLFDASVPTAPSFSFILDTMHFTAQAHSFSSLTVTVTFNMSFKSSRSAGLMARSGVSEQAMSVKALFELTGGTTAGASMAYPMFGFF